MVLFCIVIQCTAQRIVPADINLSPCGMYVPIQEIRIKKQRSAHEKQADLLRITEHHRELRLRSKATTLIPVLE